jgi:RNA polymerase sigma-70 factor (ECF subfamily)
MLQLKNGDDLALNALMKHWQTPLTAFIQRYIGSHEDALDLAQETFVRVFESRHRYEPSARFSTWLLSIASNLCRNFVRWKQRHPTVASVTAHSTGEPHDLLKNAPSPERSPADNAARNDLASAVREHIQALPHELKTAVLLFEYDQLSHEEIGQVLGCSPKAVETRLYRARKILRDALARWHIPE